MYLWQKRAGRQWLNDNEERLRARAGDGLVVIEGPAQKRLELEVICHTRGSAARLAALFGGKVEKLPRDWLKRLSRAAAMKPLRIGNRLVINDHVGKAIARKTGSPHLVYIPAGAAFGTGDHVTTAMSLRLLEQITRRWRPGWRLLDLGTGTGILALAAKRLGASRALGIDSDPIAISTAKENARINKINDVWFELGDIRVRAVPNTVDVVTANLFSELLIQIFPKIARVPWLIVSGVMRHQERSVLRAARNNRIQLLSIRRRGKWIALSARGNRTSQARFLDRARRETS